LVMTCYQMIGVPGSGKSTWISRQEWAHDCVVVSTDAYVERFAARMQSTYSEVFAAVMPRAIRLMMRRVRWAQARGLDVIWDQTSTTAYSRRRKFAALYDYQHIAVVFRTPEWPELRQRLDGRPGKHIPRKIVKSMIHSFEPPTEDEGFQEIWYAQ
jgi:predicted kinase